MEKRIHTIISRECRNWLMQRESASTILTLEFRIYTLALRQGLDYNNAIELARRYVADKDWAGTITPSTINIETMEV